MIPRFSLFLEYPKNLYLLPRDHSRALRQANEAAAVMHHTRHMSRHFEEYAIAKYGYAKRNAKYVERKMRMTGENKPLVFTGRLRHSIVSRRQIQATPKGAKLIMFPSIEGVKTGRAKSEAALKRLGRTRSNTAIINIKKVIQMNAELTTVAQDEQRAIASEIHRVYDNKVTIHRMAGTVRKRFGRS